MSIATTLWTAALELASGRQQREHTAHELAELIDRVDNLEQVVRQERRRSTQLANVAISPSVIKKFNADMPQAVSRALRNHPPK